jgi:hypothetical protein
MPGTAPPASSLQAVSSAFPNNIEAGVVLDFVEDRIQLTELVADALDCGSDVRPISIVPIPAINPS